MVNFVNFRGERGKLDYFPWSFYIPYDIANQAHIISTGPPKFQVVPGHFCYQPIRGLQLNQIHNYDWI